MRGFMGVDIFVNLLIVFLVLTGMTFMNEPPNSEKTLPSINLAKSKMDGVSIGKDTKKVTLSAKITKNDRQYFIDSDSISKETITDEIKKRGATNIDLRPARDMLYEEIMELWSLCEKGGATSISLVYEQKK